MTDYTKHNVKSAWRTLVGSVTLVSDETINSPAIYDVKILPLDINEPGAETLEINTLYYLKDYIGHTFKVLSNISNVIRIEDSFRCGFCPVSGRVGIFYKSVFNGRAPFLSQVYYKYLDDCAIDYSKSLENDILWNNDPNPTKITFLNTNEPKLENYQQVYASDYGENPKCRLMQYLDGIVLQRTELPYFEFVDGFINTIKFGILPDAIDCYIEISR